jgi:hypothetical protein
MAFTDQDSELLPIGDRRGGTSFILTHQAQLTSRQPQSSPLRFNKSTNGALTRNDFFSRRLGFYLDQYRLNNPPVGQVAIVTLRSRTFRPKRNCLMHKLTRYCQLTPVAIKENFN